LRGVTFVEHEVDDFEYGVHARRRSGRRQLEADIDLSDLPLGPYQPLRDGCLVSQECAGVSSR
jgi:hypothetical protein